MDPDEMLELAISLVKRGAEYGVTLRLLGSLAARSHIQNSGGFLDLLQRTPTHDIDFMGYSKELTNADRLFAELGYEKDRAVAYSGEYGVQRAIYHQRQEGLMAEIFLDELKMAHTLDFRGRLELDSPTISLVDLMLSKLQIVQISEKDIKDMIAILSEHDLGKGDRERVDVDYLLRLTRDDWGLYYTSHTNLGKVKEWVHRYEVIEPAVRQNVEGKVTAMLSRMEAEPKSLRWKLRARIGTKVKWYEDVGDVHDIYQ
jgi:hypothetical protein